MVGAKVCVSSGTVSISFIRKKISLELELFQDSFDFRHNIA